MTGTVSERVAEAAGIDVADLGLNPSVTQQSLRDYIRGMMQSYFTALDGHGTSGLYQMVMDTVEEPLLAAVLEYTRGNQTKAAEILGINRGTLRKKLHYHGLD